MGNRICVATFVSGKDYQEYIPLYLFSLFKSYPTYDSIIFTDNYIKDNVKLSLDQISDLGQFKIIENYQNYQVSNYSARSLSKMKRWLIYSDDFLSYEYVYIGDIDIFILPEVPGILEQHEVHCRTINLDYSNILRRKNSKRMSGLHFVRVEPYFQKMLPIIKKYTRQVQEGKFVLEYDSDEYFLYTMISESGLGMCPQASGKELNDPLKPAFRPHHGIHLAIFRNYSLKKQVTEFLFNKPLISVTSHEKSWNTAKKITDDPLFAMIVNNIEEKNIRKIVKRFQKYIGCG